MASSVYFVAITAGSKQVYQRAVEVYTSENVFRLSDDKFFVSTADTTLDVSKKVGIRSEDHIGSGIVLRVTTYNGRATPSLWEWLTPRMQQ